MYLVVSVLIYNAPLNFVTMNMVFIMQETPFFFFFSFLSGFIASEKFFFFLI